MSLITRMGSYQTPPEIGDGYTWKDAALILALILGDVAYLQWQDPSYDLERSHLYRVAYSHPAIRETTGGALNASFALVPQEGRQRFARNRPEDWKRKKEAGVIHGRARMLIFGKVGGGIFTLTYRYKPALDSFRILQIEDLGRALIAKGPEIVDRDNCEHSANFMPTRQIAPADKRGSISGVGEELVRVHGKKKHYCSRSRAQQRLFDRRPLLGLLVLHHTEGFKTLHKAAGGVCDYTIMKAEV